MKTFTATQLNKKPQEVFAAVKEDGAVEIKHDRYPDTIITMKVEYGQNWHNSINSLSPKELRAGAGSMQEAVDKIEKDFAQFMIDQTRKPIGDNDGE